MLSKLYELVDGIRYVIPYSHEFKTYAKGRWIGKELFTVMSSEFGGQSKEYWESAIRDGKVKINNTKIDKAYVFRDSDYLTHVTHRHEPPVIGNVEYVGDTADILAVSKPASMPCHPCGSYRLNSLLQILYNEPIIPNQSKLYLVHRLDRVTSGLVIIAKSLEAASNISKEIREKTTTKVYLARVKGRFPGRLTHLHSLSQEQVNAAIVEAATEGEGLDKEDFHNDNKDGDNDTNDVAGGENLGSGKLSSVEALRRNKEKQKQQQQQLLKRKQTTDDTDNTNEGINASNIPNISKKRLKRQMQAAYKAQMLAAKTTANILSMSSIGKSTATTTSTSASTEVSSNLPTEIDTIKNHNYGSDNNIDDNTVSSISGTGFVPSTGTNTTNLTSINTASTSIVSVDVTASTIYPSNDTVSTSSISISTKPVYNHLQFASLTPEDVGKGERVGYFVETTTATATATIQSSSSLQSSSSSPSSTTTYTLVCPLATQSYREGIHACHPNLGKQSITKFTSLGHNEQDDTSLVECQLLTGRTHQIRLHLQLLDSPIANDPCYGGALFYGEPARNTEALTILRRMRKQGHQPLSKIPHLLLKELDDDEEDANTTFGAEIINSKDSSSSTLTNTLEECVTDVSRKDTNDNSNEENGFTNTCRFCDDKTSTVALERILHCDGIWLHCLHMSGGNWSFQAPLPAWASKELFKRSR